MKMNRLKWKFMPKAFVLFFFAFVLLVFRAGASSTINENVSPGISDPFIGNWVELFAGRAVIEITESDEKGKYNIAITWPSSAAEKSYWELTAELVENDETVIRYENAKNLTLTWASEDEDPSEVIIYTDGKGSFTLLSPTVLIWNDETDHAAEETVFINETSYEDCKACMPEFSSSSAAEFLVCCEEAASF